MTAERMYSSVEDAVRDLYGNSVRVQTKRPVSGGDANDSSLITLSDGSRIFIKENSAGRSSFFAAEAQGLSAISMTRTISTPALICRGCDRQRGRSFLMLEYLEGRTKIPDYWEVFARELAEMHRADTGRFVTGGKYGFLNDNFIGAGEQKNDPRDSWVSFFAECRLEPQFDKASRYFSPTEKARILNLMDRLGDYLTEPAHPSLLHGDLWGGNFVTGNDGKAWLIDPAVYVGHAEADIAMTELFGGFSPQFYDAYGQEGDLDPGYEDRRDLYNLYHLVNHLNLFGGGYHSSVMRIVTRYSG